MELDDIRCLAVLGLQRSGRPAALLGRRRLPAARVVALDEGAAPPEDAAAELRAAGVEVLFGEAAALPAGVDLLVKSPGVPNESAAVQEALRRGVTVWSEVEFAARFLAAGGPVTRPIDHVIGGGSRRCRPDIAVLLPHAVSENVMVASASQIAPFTGRPDRAVIVEELRRKFLSSRLGDAYYAAMTRLF